MSDVVDAVDDALDEVPIVKETWEIVKDVADKVWQEVFNPIIESSLGLFGIEDETVVQAQVSTHAILEDNDGIDYLLTQIALKHQKTDIGIIDLMSTHSLGVRDKLSFYYQYGEEFIDGYPEADLRKATIDKDLVVSVINDEYNISATIITNRVKVPDKLEYCGYVLNNMYDYKPYNRTMVYNSVLYEEEAIDYNYDTDKYDIYIYRPVVEKTEITVNITPYDEEFDTKETTTEVTLTAEEGQIDYDITTTTELIPINTESDSYTVSEQDIQYSSTMFSIDSFLPKQYIVVKYYYQSSGEYYYWLYKFGSGNSTLDNSRRYVTGLEMLPVVELRNNKVNVNSDKESERYKDTKEILDFIGIDVDTMVSGITDNPDSDSITAAYIHFGFNPNESDPLVAKMLYQMFNFAFYDASLESGEDGFSLTFKENKYNILVAWEKQERNTYTGTIGSIGTYTNVVRDIQKNDRTLHELVIRKQVLENSYVEYTITNLTGITFVKYGGYTQAVNSYIQNNDMYIPLSIYFVESLTPIEQMEIFTKSLQLSIYAMTITELGYYETEEFADFIKIAAIVVAVVITVLTADPSASIGQILVNIVTNLAIGAAAAYAMGRLMEATDNEVIQIVGSIVIISAAVWGTSSVNAGEFLTPTQLVDTVTEFGVSQTINISSQVSNAGISITSQGYQNEFEDVQKEWEAWEAKVTSKEEELSTEIEKTLGGIATEFYSRLNQLEETEAYIEGVDLMRYKAGPIQYDYDLLYDFDSMKDDWVDSKLKLGII